MSQQTDNSRAVIACHRFGFGPLTGELETAAIDPQAFLQQQLLQPEFDPSLPDSASIQKMLVQIREQQKAGNDQNKRYPQQTYLQLTQDTLLRAINSEHSLSWRLLDFFSNHFSVSANGRVMRALAPTLEREAIAPNLLGSFEEMLLAVIKHPAMLIYLNNEKSFGPNSRLGKRGRGMNENLAREILELHTLGVSANYTLTDVQQLAKGITGWSLANPKRDNQTGFQFKSAGHEPGSRTLLGNTYPQPGVEQGEAMLRDLARHPDTIKHLCYKLARHFIQDEPSPMLLDDLQQSWTGSSGNIKQVMETLIANDLAWQVSKQKYKSPREFVISAYRATGLQPKSATKLVTDLQKLGQKPFDAGSPAGFDDVSAAWDGASALDARIEWSASLAAMSRINSNMAIVQSFADTLSTNTSTMLNRAESQHSSLTMLLLSPEFLFR